MDPESFYYSWPPVAGQQGCTLRGTSAQPANAILLWFKICGMRHEARIALLISLLILSACTVYREHPVKTFSDATGGEGLERAFWTALQKQDWKDVERHLAGNFVYATPGKTLDRAEALEQFQQMQIQEFSIGDLSTEMNRDAFVVTYAVTLRGTADGQTFPSQPERRMSVWQEQKNGWVMIAHTILSTATE